MRILIVDGWTKDGSLDHLHAGCVTQAQIFESLIKEKLPEVLITTVDTCSPGSTADTDLSQFRAAIWTGGGGSIYEANDFNRGQLDLCERVLSTVPYLWGSCWGMQVVVSVFGGSVSRARIPEIGIASGIELGSSDTAKKFFSSKPPKFDAPAHHRDEIVRLPGMFEVLAENHATMQAITTNGGQIFCTQYHPELPYDYIGKLLSFWAANYRDLFTEHEFHSLLTTLSMKENAEGDTRKIEFQNWLASLSQDLN